LRPGPHSQCPTVQEKLDELEICQAAIFVAAMCGLEWLKDQARDIEGPRQMWFLAVKFERFSMIFIVMA
jgi:hypothetical protein